MALIIRSSLLLMFLSIFSAPYLYGQTAFAKHFSSLIVKVDTAQYSYDENRIKIQGTWKIPFEFSSNETVLTVQLVPSTNQSTHAIYRLLPSQGYTIIDTLSLRIEGYYQCKVRFNNLYEAGETGLILEHNNAILDIPLFPYSTTKAAIYPGDSDFYIGEEKVFELITNRSDNIKPEPFWTERSGYEYRTYKKDNKAFVSILPTRSGQLNIEIPVNLKRPNLSNGKLNYQLKPIQFSIEVKGSRLTFLQFDKREVIWEQGNRKGVELQIDNHRFLELNKTYRLEDTDEKGGPLIAELYTVRRLTNDKVLCMLRPYNYHAITSGYLFIKDGDNAKFITNIDILPEPKIEQVSILREGGSWVNSRQIYPGETVEIRLEGEGLSRAKFGFEDLIDVSKDSLVKNDVISHYLLKVPISIRKKSVNIYNGKHKTGVTLDIQEYQRPRELDFVIVEYGGVPVVASEVNQPILHNGTIGNVSLTFDDEYIDEPNKLYGKQFLEVEVRIKDDNNKLIEKQVIDDITVCPGSTSPRSFSYTSPSGCMNEGVSINKYLSNKTHSLENWSTVELIIKHRQNVYGGRGHTERIEIIKEKQVTFDVDLSIPAGLIIKKAGVPGFPGLSGISLSMLAQFSFYQKGEIQKLRPYKIGAGFLAQNAFNFNPEAERDLGIVILGSVYPTKKGRKFSFPLYAGFGYFLNEDKFFYLIGPGIRINF